MIEDPPLLQIRRRFPRPSPDLVGRFAGIPTEHLVDAMDGRGALDYRLRPISGPPTTFIGPAVTCLCAPGDHLAIEADVVAHLKCLRLRRFDVSALRYRQATELPIASHQRRGMRPISMR